MNTNGAVLDGTPIKISDSAADFEQAPAVSRGDGNKWGVTYYRGPFSGGSAQVVLRSVSPK